VKSDDTYEMHDQIYAPLELPPSLAVAGDPGSIESNKNYQKIKEINKIIKKYIKFF
jgi:hypothetical protein